MRRHKKSNLDAIVRDLAELNIGSPVVHIDHGIGRYLGLQTITLDEVDALINPLKQNPHFFLSLKGPSESNVTLPDNAKLLQEAYAAMKTPVTPYTEKTVASELIKNKPIKNQSIKYGNK